MENQESGATPQSEKMVRVLHDDQEIEERRLPDAEERILSLEKRLQTTKTELSHMLSQNEKLSYTLREARDHIAALREEVDKLTQPPSAYGVLLGINSDGTYDVFSSGRKMRVTASPAVSEKELEIGSQVALNDMFAIILARRGEQDGEVVTCKEVLPDKQRVLVVGTTDDQRVVPLAAWLQNHTIRSGDLLLLESRSGVAVEKIEKPQTQELVLEEVPDISYADVGGLDKQIEQITDAVELPFLYHDLFSHYQLPAPKGILLYGPPGCGKTLIAKAVANSLAKKIAQRHAQESGKVLNSEDNPRSYFLNIKGPELLNKYVGETERQIRQIFERAREKSEEGWPVIVFFDEMDSLFRTRGTGISSDMESTIVPQLLAEIDGVETLKNVIVIGASNREDLIDPAILRPGRLDVKIKIERPNKEAAKQIFHRYIHPNLPLDTELIHHFGNNDVEKTLQLLIDTISEEMYATNEENQFLEVTYQNGEKEILYFKDFSSGAMIENIVRRAKKSAIKRELTEQSRGLRLQDFLDAIHQEYKEHEDLPNTTNPDDWAKISGKKGERIIYIRTLITQEKDSPLQGGRSIERVATGQYL